MNNKAAITWNNTVHTRPTIAEIYRQFIKELDKLEYENKSFISRFFLII